MAKLFRIPTSLFVLALQAQWFNKSFTALRIKGCLMACHFRFALFQRLHERIHGFGTSLQATAEVRAPWLAQQQEAGLGVDHKGWVSCGVGRNVLAKTGSSQSSQPRESEVCGPPTSLLLWQLLQQQQLLLQPRQLSSSSRTEKPGPNPSSLLNAPTSRHGELSWMPH